MCDQLRNQRNQGIRETAIYFAPQPLLKADESEDGGTFE